MMRRSPPKITPSNASYLQAIIKRRKTAYVHVADHPVYVSLGGYKHPIVAATEQYYEVLEYRLPGMKLAFIIKPKCNGGSHSTD